MRQNIVNAFKIVYDEAESFALSGTSPEMVGMIEHCADVILNEDEFVLFTEGTDKLGYDVIGWESYMEDTYGIKVNG